MVIDLSSTEVCIGALVFCGLLFFISKNYGPFFGYAQPRFSGQVLGKKEQAVLVACAETLFPSRDTMPLTGVEAGIVEYFDSYLAELPKEKRLQIRALIQFIEHSPTLFVGKRRFSALPVAEREAFLASMATSRFYFRRVCFLSLRTLTCMAYLAHPDIAAKIGSAPNTRPFDVGASA